MPIEEVDWGDSISTTIFPTCPNCQLLVPLEHLPTGVTEEYPSKATCPKCNFEFVWMWTSSARSYHTTKPLPVDGPEKMVANGECPYCHRPFYSGKTCTSCDREFCPKCDLELDNGECEDCDE